MDYVALEQSFSNGELCFRGAAEIARYCNIFIKFNFNFGWSNFRPIYYSYKSGAISS